MKPITCPEIVRSMMFPSAPPRVIETAKIARFFDKSRNLYAAKTPAITRKIAIVIEIYAGIGMLKAIPEFR